MITDGLGVSCPGLRSTDGPCGTRQGSSSSASSAAPAQCLSSCLSPLCGVVNAPQLLPLSFPFNIYFRRLLRVGASALVSHWSDFLDSLLFLGQVLFSSLNLYFILEMWLFIKMISMIPLHPNVI